MSNIVNSKFFSFMSTVGDLILLNILFILCSLPIITIGASATALYSSTKSILNKEYKYASRNFFKFFKENFKNSTIQWIILLIVGYLLGIYTFYVANYLNNILLLVPYIMLFVIYTFILLYAFALQSNFENKPLTILKNAFFTACKHLPYTLPVYIITYFPMVLTLRTSRSIAIAGPFWIVIGFSLTSLVRATLLQRKVFQIYFDKEEQLKALSGASSDKSDSSRNA